MRATFRPITTTNPAAPAPLSRSAEGVHAAAEPEPNLRAPDHGLAAPAHRPLGTYRAQATAATSSVVDSWTRIPAPSLEAAQAAYNADVPSGFTWSSVDALEAYAICPGGPSGAALLEALAERARFAPRGGLPVTPATAADVPWFGDAGPGAALAAAVLGFGEGAAHEVHYAEDEIPSHNSTTFQGMALVSFPERRLAVALSGTHGYDS